MLKTKINCQWFVPDRLIWVIAIVGVFIFQGLQGPRPLDDAYITYRYARNISSGIGFVYNPGELVQGTTTPLYTLLLALFAAVLGPERIPLVSFGIALIADALNAWLIFRIAKYFLKQELAALILAAVFLFHPLRINVSVGGMETSLFITLLLAVYDRYFIGSKIYAAAILSSLAILTRLDAILAIGPVLLHAFWRNRTSFWKASLLGAAILAPWMVWATWYFGNPIPFSITAKSAAYQNYSPGMTLLLVLTFLGTGTVGPYKELAVLYPGLVIVLFLVMVGFSWIKNGNQHSLVMVSYPLLYFTVMIVQHAPLFFAWYYLPLMPGLLLLLFGAFQKLFSARTLIKNRYSQAVLFGLCGVSIVVVPALLMHFMPGWADSRQIERLYQEASASVQGETANTLVFAPDIGVIGWNLDQARILDPIGLVSPVSIRYLQEYRGLDFAAIYMVRDFEPDFVIAREGFISLLIDDPDFQENYQLSWQKSTVFEGQDKVVVYERK